MADDDYWFAPKRYGIGSGLPLRWQGWVAFLMTISVILAIVALFRDRPVQMIAALIPVTLVFVVVCANKTRGGWRWRWGEDE